MRRHIQAFGGEDKVEAVRSTVTHAEYREGTFVMPGAYGARMDPYYKTIRDRTQPLGDVCEGYDGSAWEWYGDPGVVLRTVGAAAAAARHGTDLIDCLVGYKTRGTRIEFRGSDRFDQPPVYKLPVIATDGFEKDLFCRSAVFLIVGARRSARVHAFGDPVHSENRFSDHRPVNGVLFRAAQAAGDIEGARVGVPAGTATRSHLQESPLWVGCFTVSDATRQCDGPSDQVGAPGSHPGQRLLPIKRCNCAR